MLLLNMVEHVATVGHEVDDVIHILRSPQVLALRQVLEVALRRVLDVGAGNDLPVQHIICVLGGRVSVPVPCRLLHQSKLYLSAWDRLRWLSVCSFTNLLRADGFIPSLSSRVAVSFEMARYSFNAGVMLLPPSSPIYTRSSNYWCSRSKSVRFLASNTT